jgi:hypothetical protein
LLASFLAYADAGLAAEVDEALKAVVLALSGDEDVVKPALSGLEGFFHRMQAIENFHIGIV